MGGGLATIPLIPESRVHHRCLRGVHSDRPARSQAYRNRRWAPLGRLIGPASVTLWRRARARTRLDRRAGGRCAGLRRRLTGRRGHGRNGRQRRRRRRRRAAGRRRHCKTDDGDQLDEDALEHVTPPCWRVSRVSLDRRPSGVAVPPQHMSGAVPCALQRHRGFGPVAVRRSRAGSAGRPARRSQRR
jgi:hypothetical protein